MNENYLDRMFSPGETVWHNGVLCVVLKCHADNEYTVVPKTGPNRNRQIPNVPAEDLGVYTELQRLDDLITEKTVQLRALETEINKLKRKRYDVRRVN